MIESYKFGDITIDGRHYGKDVIILPEGSVIHPWWRKSGHRLTMTDIQVIVAAAPDLLIVGTGDSGLMKPDDGLHEALLGRGIEMKVAPTARAVEAFNLAHKKGTSVAGCFHLTC
jgi:hypothetical protein